MGQVDFSARCSLCIVPIRKHWSICTANESHSQWCKLQFILCWLRKDQQRSSFDDPSKSTARCTQICDKMKKTFSRYFRMSKNTFINFLKVVSTVSRKSSNITISPEGRLALTWGKFGFSSRLSFFCYPLFLGLCLTYSVQKNLFFTLTVTILYVLFITARMCTILVFFYASVYFSLFSK